MSVTSKWATKLAQREDERREFVLLLQREGVRSYLEIGLRNGNTFAYVGTRLPPGTTMVGVDLPGGPWGVPTADVTVARLDMERAARRVREHGQIVEIIEGDSHSAAVLQRVREVRSHYDALFIDADHSYDGVRADWLNYGPLARIVAFHDIDIEQNPKAPPGKIERYGTHVLWRALKPRYRHWEIIGRQRGMGIGVLWR